MDAVLPPVNQRIVVVEPAVSQDGGDRLVERSDIEVYRDDLSGGEVKGQTGSPSHHVVGRTVE